MFWGRDQHQTKTIYYPKPPVANNWKSFNQRKLGVSWSVELIQQGACSFYQEVKWSRMPKLWHNFFIEKCTNAKKTTEKKLIGSWRQTRSYLKGRQKLAWCLWGKSDEITKNDTFDTKVDGSKTRLSPDQFFYRRKITVANYWKISHRKKLWVPYWVEVTQQRAPSFRQKVNWSKVAKEWRNSKRKKLHER